MKKITGIVLCLFMIMSIFTGCTNHNDENVINIYTAIEEEYVEEYIKDFKEKYPEIEVNIIRDSSGVVSAKLLVERENPRADVVWGIPASNVLVLEKYDIFHPYKSERLDEIDPKFYDTATEIPRWVGISSWMTAITVNVKELEAKGLPIPYTYEDLLNPEYKQSIVMPNPASSGTGFLTVSGLMQILGEEEGFKYLDALHNNIKEYSHSGSSPTKQAAKGEALIGIGMDFLSLQMEADNPQIKTILPEEGSGWELEVLALIRKPKIKESAKKFYEWALSKDTMQMYAENRSLITEKDYTPAGSDAYKNGVKEQMIENNLTWAAENRNRILKLWEEKYGAGE